MTIYRQSKGNYEQHEEVEIFTEKYTSNVGGKALLTCDGEKFFGEPDKAPEVVVDDNLDFISASWSKDFEGKMRVGYDTSDEKGYRAQLEDTVYFQLNVNKRIEPGTVIKFELYDKNTLLGIDNLAFDDKITNSEYDGKETPATGNGIVRFCVGEKYNKVTFKLYLNPSWKDQLEDDKGSFKDGCLDLYLNWTYNDTIYTVDKDTLILSVYYSRDLFISEAYPSKYRFPEVIDSNTGEFIIFLGNEGGDIAGTIDSKIEKFYAVRIKVISEYNFHGGTNEITKKMYEEKYNLRTGKSSRTDLFKITESVEFKIKNSSKITNVDSNIEKEVLKKFSDYYNINDIGKLGIRGMQEALNVLGYLDLFGDLQDAVAGRGLSTYDTVGLGTTAAEMALKVAAAKEAKLGILTAEEIALMALPEWVTPVTFGLAVFEETITKPFVADVMQAIEEALFWRMELAKKKGLSVVRDVAFEKQMTGYFKLIEGIPQQKHDEVFSGKIKTLNELEQDNDMLRYENPKLKTYVYLLRLTETDQQGEFNYNIESIFI